MQKFARISILYILPSLFLPYLGWIAVNRWRKQKYPPKNATKPRMRFESVKCLKTERAVRLVECGQLRNSTEFNSCANRPDVCKYLVVQTAMDNMSKRGAEHLNVPHSLANQRIKVTSSCEVKNIQAQDRKPGSNRVNGCVIWPGCQSISCRYQMSAYQYYKYVLHFFLPYLGYILVHR